MFSVSKAAPWGSTLKLQVMGEQEEGGGGKQAS